MSLSHVVDELARQFLQSLLGQKSRVMLEIVEGNELDDISSSVFTELTREKSFIVTIKLVHHAEISITDTNNNDSKWVIGSSHNFVNSAFHVINHTVSDNHENLELLVLIVAWISLTHAIDSVKNFTEVSRSIQIDCLVADAVFVVRHHFRELINTRVKDVTIHGKAMRSPLIIREDCTTKAEQVNLLVRVVELQDATDLINDLQILIFLHVPVVERIRVVGRTI